MRILIDEEDFTWDDAWQVVTKTFFYTNHTVLPVRVHMYACCPSHDNPRKRWKNGLWIWLSVFCQGIPQFINSCLFFADPSGRHMQIIYDIVSQKVFLVFLANFYIESVCHCSFFHFHSRADMGSTVFLKIFPSMYAKFLSSHTLSLINNSFSCGAEVPRRPRAPCPDVSY